MAGFFDWLTEPTKQTTGTTKTKLPAWMDQAGKYNYGIAQLLSSKPYQAYPFDRIAGFDSDQKKAMSMLRGYAPDARRAAGDFDVPRLIDKIGKGGTIDAYMNPYIDQVLDRTQERIRESTDMAHQWQDNATMHQDGAFGDARHGIADANTEYRGMQLMKDASAEGYAAAYDNAMNLRNTDINRMFNVEEVNRGRQDDFLKYVDSLYRSGSNQQALSQKNLDMGYADFLRQQQHPYDMFNLLQAALNGTPYTKTSTTQEPGPSQGGQLLGGLGSILSMFL